MLFGDWERVNKHSGKYSVGTVEEVDLIDEDNDISGMGFSANFLTFLSPTLLFITFCKLFKTF